MMFVTTNIITTLLLHY